LRRGREELYEIGEPGLVRRVVAHVASVSVTACGFWRIGPARRSSRGFRAATSRLGHLRSGCWRSITLGDSGHDCLGNDERLAVTAVETDRKIPGELEMLTLVVSDGTLSVS